MALPPLLVELTFTNLDLTNFVSTDSPPNKNIYLWLVFFKVDGDSVILAPNTHPQSGQPVVNLQGSVIAFDRAGDHGDIPGTGSGGVVAIPPTLGQFHTTLRPIRIDSSIAAAAGSTVLPGVVGCLALIMLQQGTPNDDISAGHTALNQAFQQQLNLLIPNLGLGQESITPQNVSALESAVSSAVTDGVKGAMSIFNKLAVWFNLEGQDTQLGSASSIDTPEGNYAYTRGNEYFLFSQSDLAASGTTPMEATVEQDLGSINWQGPDVISTVILNGQVRTWTPFWLQGFESIQILDADHVLVLGSDLNLWLEYGPFGHVPPPRSQVDGDVAAFQALDNATAYVLGTDGNLWLEHGPFDKVPPERSQVDTTVAAFQALDTQTVFVLGTDGNLWREHAPFGSVPPQREQVDGNVLSFQAPDDPDSDTVLVLGTDGNLWLEQAPFGSVPPARQHVDGNVQAFQGSRFFESKIFVLGTNGNLWLENPPFGQVPPGRQQIDGNVQAFRAQVLLDFVWVLGSDGKLWLEQGPFGTVPPQRQLIDANVRAFQPLDLSDAVVLGTNGNLWLEHAPFGTPPPKREQIDGNVR
jgi:hypothetical protein